MRINFAILAVLMIAASAVINGQSLSRDLSVTAGQTVEVINRFGRVDIVAQPTSGGDSDRVGINERATTPSAEAAATLPQTKRGAFGEPLEGGTPNVSTLSIISKSELSENEIVCSGAKGRLRIEVQPSSTSKRVDLTLSLPERTKLIVQTRDGGILVEGNFDSLTATTDTGTIAVDVPTENLSYDLNWTMSKPRILADFEIEEVRERSGGRFQIKGVVGEQSKKKKKKSDSSETPAEPMTYAERQALKGNGESEKSEVDEKDTDKKEAKASHKKAKDEEKSKAVALNFTTARGIVLLNVAPNEVMSDLRERPLTDAAKAIVRSGDSFLIDAIRRASPKYFGDYAKTLPPAKFEPRLTASTRANENVSANVKTATARVLDMQNRAVAALTAEDFEVTENGEPREVISARPVTAPFNLVLLLDVSGSVDTYVNFIRKAARAFVNTVDPNDRVSIVLFNDDVKVLAGFTTDKTKLSESLDTFDAGGGTAYYDAIGYTLVETLRPMKGDRTAIVVLTDGDDNRSFLPFDSLAGTIEESGALIYPLYVPTSLAAIGATQDLNTSADPLRTKYLNVSLTSKAETEGARLAKISGGVYYPITQLSQIQKAYEDIVVQLRTAYDVTFKSDLSTPDGKPSPRLKIRSKKPNTFVQLGRVTARQ